MTTIKQTHAITGEVTELHINEVLNIGQRFRLIGRTPVFTVTKLTTTPFGIIATGDSLDGRFRTGALACDTAAV